VPPIAPIGGSLRAIGGSSGRSHHLIGGSPRPRGNWPNAADFLRHDTDGVGVGVRAFKDVPTWFFQ
jgi:hypothetical protein